MSRVVDKVGPMHLGRNALAAFETVRVHAGYQARYLRIDNRRAFEVGNRCGTCAHWFSRLEGANRNVSVEEVRDRLAEGLSSVSDVAVERFSAVLSPGDYVVLLMDVRPQLTAPDEPVGYFASEQIKLWGLDGFWGLPHYPKVPYYRLDDSEVTPEATLFEFLVPIYPPTWLEGQTVFDYAETIKAESSSPTVVALSVLDIKQPATWGDDVTVSTHWCLTHFVLDGHHKLFAAASVRRQIRLLSFLAVGEGPSGPDDISRLLSLL